MSRLTDEIDALVTRRLDRQPHFFEPVQAKRRRLERRRYAMTAAATLVVAALVGYQLQGDSAHKAAPAVLPTATMHTPVPATPTPTGPQRIDLPPLAGTVWAIDDIGPNPHSDASGRPALPSYLFAAIQFSTDSDGVLRIGNAIRPVHLALDKAKDTLHITEGELTPLNISGDVVDADGAITRVIYNGLKIESSLSGTQIQLFNAEGYTMHLTRLDPVGPLGRPGDKSWSVRAVSGPHGAVPVAPSLNARMRVEESYEVQFAVGANTAIRPVAVKDGEVELLPFPFSTKPAKPGELAVTRAIAALKGRLTATHNGRTLVLTSSTGASITLVSTG